MARPLVVSYLASTSNHNYCARHKGQHPLFLILHLHQTTTLNVIRSFVPGLFLILHLHQTTTVSTITFGLFWLFLILHLHQTTTKSQSDTNKTKLFLILHLHQTTTNRLNLFLGKSCFLSCIYIKPQPSIVSWCSLNVVSYLASTSNHNIWADIAYLCNVVSYLASTSNHNLYYITVYTSET